MLPRHRQEGTLGGAEYPDPGETPLGYIALPMRGIGLSTAPGIEVGRSLPITPAAGGPEFTSRGQDGTLVQAALVRHNTGGGV